MRVYVKTTWMNEGLLDGRSRPDSCHVLIRIPEVSDILYVQQSTGTV